MVRKSDLSALSLLVSRHINIVRLLGVTLRPLGLILELAPKSSLKALLQSYAEAQMKIQCNVAQAVVVQVRLASSPGRRVPPSFNQSLLK